MTTPAGMTGRTWRRPVVAAAVAAVAAALTASCGGDDDAESGLAPVAASPPPAPSATTQEPSSADPEAEAAQAAFTAVRDYMVAKDELLENPMADAAEALTVIGVVAAPDRIAAIGTAQDSQYFVEQGWRSEGRSVVSGENAAAVDLAADPPVVVVEYCWSLAGVRVVDTAGETVEFPDRPDEYQARSEVVLVGGEWLVATEDLHLDSNWIPAEVNPCTSP